MTDKMEGAKVACAVRKAKKKQVKDELDRIKQAEKKKRRLEKALATSAAIRSELEKKKQKKKEEQQRLDEEGAAIAEAVALQVLLGEDSDDSCEVMMKKDEGLNQWDYCSNFDVFMGRRREELIAAHQDHLSKYSLERLGLVSSDNHGGYRCMWNNDWGNNDWMVSSEPVVGGAVYPQYQYQYVDERNWENAGISAGLVAAQAVSSLQIAEDAQVDKYVFNRVLRG
ncbi:hypothetical protein M9H77_26659 [Catharanthus roseus]|uniref:Uncharacterized protein n=1 Tax=Catharanthus roseus TaxID=4058 RepID=A0ACC0AAS4_CATRO|nr:hypothetical protein M9H77_26659 [Catharanthus roseus]